MRAAIERNGSQRRRRRGRGLSRVDNGIHNVASLSFHSCPAGKESGTVGVNMAMKAAALVVWVYSLGSSFGAAAFQSSSRGSGCPVGWGCSSSSSSTTQLEAMKGRAVVANVTMFVEDIRRWAKEKGISLPMGSNAAAANGFNASSNSTTTTTEPAAAAVKIPRRWGSDSGGGARSLGVSFNLTGDSFDLGGKIPEGLKEPLRQARVSLGMALVDLGLSPNDRLGVVLSRFKRLSLLLEQREAENGVALLPDAGVSDDEVLPTTDISSGGRKIWIVTTAALPWMTGTSVNPLLRAAFLTMCEPANEVTLMLPWLEKSDQKNVFSGGKSFESPAEQQAVVEEWLRKAGMEEAARRLRILWYPSRYLEKMGSIFPMGDITKLIPDSEADVCILEEPEHINWYRATGTNWSKKFRHVVGIVHTNYIYYAAQDRNTFGGQMKGPWVRGFNKIMARAYCDKLIKLSATLQKFAEEKEVVCNVHGVRDDFLRVGDEVHGLVGAHGGEEEQGGAATGATTPGFTAGAYMLGKMLWEKGYDRLWDLMAETGGRLDGAGAFPIDVYGSGPELEEITERAESLGLPVTFHGATDHAQLKHFRVFVNPSVSEVLCTTIAEALAMGKWVVCARHTSNEFFYQFPNCLPFSTSDEFAQQMNKALTTDPSPLTPELRHCLSWKAATERLTESAKVTVGEARARRRELDEMAWVVHYYLGHGKRGDTIRKIMQAGEVAAQNAFSESVEGLGLKSNVQTSYIEALASKVELP